MGGVVVGPDLTVGGSKSKNRMTLLENLASKGHGAGSLDRSGSQIPQLLQVMKLWCKDMLVISIQTKVFLQLLNTVKLVQEKQKVTRWPIKSCKIFFRIYSWLWLVKIYYLNLLIPSLSIIKYYMCQFNIVYVKNFESVLPNSSPHYFNCLS